MKNIFRGDPNLGITSLYGGLTKFLDTDIKQTVCYEYQNSCCFANKLELLPIFYPVV